MNNIDSRQGLWGTEVKKSATRLLLWTGIWVVTLGVLAFAPRLMWNLNTAATTLVVFVNLGIGIGMITAHIRHLRRLDEMQQKVILEAALLTLGVGLVCGASYQLWEDVQLISFELDISHLIILMSFTFMAKILSARWRNR